MRTRFVWVGTFFLLAVASDLLLSGAPEERRVSVFSSVANYSLPVVQRNGQDYVGLLEILEPLGTVSAKLNGQRWKFRYDDVDCEFTNGKTRGRVRDGDLDLPGNFILENGRGLVPLSSLNVLLGRILGGPVTLNQTARRVFVGNVAVHFTAQVVKNGPEKLVMNFTSPVNPTIATEPGKLRMTFTHEPVVAPGVQVLNFDSNTIPSARFQEANGSAEIIVNSTSPVMASFSNDGRTIIVAPAAVAASAAPPANKTTQAPPALPPPNENLPAALLGSTTVTAMPQHYFAVVDASHGGDERGAALSITLAEKDVNLAFARRLRQELDSRGLPTMLVREGDTTLAVDQRAAMSNGSGAAIYISIHTTSQGLGVRLYTALPFATSDSHGPFIDWDAAQNSFAEASQSAAEGIEAELRNKQISVRTLAAPLRPLNNISSAALAVEIAPSEKDVSQLTSVGYQQLVVGAVAAGVADVRSKLQANAK